MTEPNIDKQALREQINEIVGEVATKGMIGMQLAMHDGSKKHHEKVLKEAGDLIETLFHQHTQTQIQAVLDELLEWHEYWTSQHEKPFNWYGAVKALKVSKDHKKPFAVIQSEREKL